MLMEMQGTPNWRKHGVNKKNIRNFYNNRGHDVSDKRADGLAGVMRDERRGGGWPLDLWGEERVKIAGFW
jgi:hypothetical protein